MITLLRYVPRQLDAWFCNKSLTPFTNTCVVAAKNGEEYYCCPSQINDNYGMLKDVECDRGNIRSCRFRITGKEQYSKQAQLHSTQTRKQKRTSSWRPFAMQGNHNVTWWYYSNIMQLINSINTTIHKTGQTAYVWTSPYRFDPISGVGESSSSRTFLVFFRFGQCALACSCNLCLVVSVCNGLASEKSLSSHIHAQYLPPPNSSFVLW
jgi:hypothetical protein